MSDITLSAGIRQNLLSLQNTSAELTATQEALATGNKVNKAADNPTAYFTSQSLTNTANDLSSLLDQIGQGQQTIDAANNGLTSLTSLLEQALSTAQQAQQAPTGGATTYGAVNVNGNVPTAFQETLGSVTGSAVGGATTIGAAAAGTLNIVVGGTTTGVSLGAADTITTAKTKIDTALGATNPVSATLVDAGAELQINSADAATNFTIVDNATSEALGLTTNANVTSTSTDIWSALQTAGVQQGDVLTVAVNGGATQDIAFGTGAGQVASLYELNQALGNLTGLSSAGVAGNTVSFQVAGNSPTQTSLTIGTNGSTDSSAILTGLGLHAGTTQGTASVGAVNATRASLQDNYNGLLTQITQMAGDSSYNGVNLLNGDNLVVDFNPTGSSSLTITGVTYSATGLGLDAVSGNWFQSDGNIQDTITAINNAISTVRSQTETFGTNSGVISARQTFETNMINTLQTGASNLVVADQNQESADLLTEQTQQQLEISALSIANQANQSVLKLFG
ncbi:MAG TPA: flagellin [Xanthobacteraceae bacterium]|nr:flagellin [Xanthobacteraceae bacterium]